MEAPKSFGKFQAHFRMETEHKVKFGHKVWCDILVGGQQPEVSKENSLLNSVLQNLGQSFELVSEDLQDGNAGVLAEPVYPTLQDF